MNQNTSVMDSQGGGQAQSRHELGDEQSEMTRREDNSKERYIRIKNVFRLLIEQSPYLVDDKSYERCEGKSAKEQFSIKIDAIRKSLDISSMEDVHLLVDELYKFQEEYEKEMEEKAKADELELAEVNSEAGGNEEAHTSLNERNRTSNEATMNGNPEAQPKEEDEEVDPNRLQLAEELITLALKRFYEARQRRNLLEGLHM